AGRSGVGQPSARNARSGLLSRTPRRASWSVPLRHAVPPVFRSSIEMEALSFAATLGNADSETKLACTVAAVGGAQRLVRYMKCGQSQVGPGSLWLLPGTSLCPTTCVRSRGTPCRAEIAQASAAAA